jgi:hypothetical protein
MRQRDQVPANPQTRANGVLKLMPHFAGIFFIAFTLAAASCSVSERAQKEEAERKEAARQVTVAYYSCVRTSFASQLPTMVDSNMAIDQAFLVCKTEESKLHALENTLSGNPNVSNAAMSSHRNALKEELVRR